MNCKILSVFVLFTACTNTPVCVEGDRLCSRNEYSINGVASYTSYEYRAKEGEIDFSSQQLYEFEKFDSLGNVIYHNGQYYPNIEHGEMSNYHYAIRDAVGLSIGAKISYKLQYVDSTLSSIFAFDEDGDYIGRVEHTEKGRYYVDSVYSRSGLIYIRELYTNINGRDSVSLDYQKGKGNVMYLAEKNTYTYTSVNDSTEIREWKMYEPPYGSTKIRLYLEDNTTDIYNKNGDLISRCSDSMNIHREINDAHKPLSITTYNNNRKSTRYTEFTYNELGLEISSKIYIDGVLDIVHENQYTFYDYSPYASSESKQNE